MAEIVRLGILGTGNMAKAFASSLAYSSGIELVAVASRRQESAEQFAEQFRISKPYTGIGAMLEDGGTDLVYIASPHAMHCQDTLHCLEAGTAVLCEKPFAINAHQARLMIEKAREKNLFLMEAMWSRYIPAIVRLRELLADNVIGKVNLMLAGGAFMPHYDPQAYLFRPDLGGGVLLDAGVYLVSMASMLFGVPSKILATGSIGDSGVDEHDAFLLQHDDEAIACLHVSLRASASPEILLLGERGKIRVHAPLFAPRRLTLSRTGSDDQTIDLPFEGNGYQFEAMEAAKNIRAGKTESNLMPLDETLAIMRTMDEIRRQINLTYPMEM
jgi:predicted dehydrogenase